MDPLVRLTGDSYNYVRQNPVKYIDPKGLFKTRFGAWLHRSFHGGGEIKNSSSRGYYYNKSSFNENGEVTITAVNGKDIKIKNSVGSKIVTNTGSYTTEKGLISKNILVSATANATTTYGKAGILNSDIKVTNGSSTSYENQANLGGVLKSNIGYSKEDISAGAGVSLFGYYDFSVGVKLTTDVFNSEFSVGISENINKDNTSTGLNVGIKPVGLLLLYRASRTGNLSLPPVLQPAVN